ncbi:MAG: O-antigen ligase family protein [Bacteroidota bacterium]
MKIIFSLVFIFNILHYFNVFDFNKFVSPFYTSWMHLKFFGLNTLGQVDTKRAFGTMGNCNNNAFYFLSFLILFIDQYIKSKSKSDLTFLILALFGIFLCQSRIVFLTLIVLLFLSILILKNSRKFFLALLGLTLLFYLLFYLAGNVYLVSVQRIDLMTDASIGRFEQWIKIYHSMPGYWFFGHAPNKEYFETHQIYAESEYFLILFRYGVLGLLLFLGILAIAMIKFFKVFKFSFFPLAFVFSYSLNCITNSPFYGTKSLIQFAFFYVIILFLNDARKIEK